MKHKARIEKVTWLDRDAQEAKVLFVIADKSLTAFSYPCTFEDNEVADVELTFIENEIPDYVFWNENSKNIKDIVQAESNDWMYYCYGQLVSVEPMLVNCGAVTFNLGAGQPDTSSLGNYVYFVIGRLDIRR